MGDGQIWVWGKGRKARGLDGGHGKGRPGKIARSWEKWNKPGLRAKHREGVRIPLPGLSQACLSSDVCPEMGPILGQPPFSLVAMDWGEHVRDDGACIVGEGAPVRSGEHWK